MYATIGWGQAVCPFYGGCLLLSIYYRRFHCIYYDDKEERAGFKLPTFFSKLAYFGYLKNWSYGVCMHSSYIGVRHRYYRHTCGR